MWENGCWYLVIGVIALQWPRGATKELIEAVRSACVEPGAK